MLHGSAVQQHRPCTTEVTPMRVRVTIAAAEKQLVSCIVNSCLYSCSFIPQANRIFRSPYYIVIYDPSGCLHHIFPHYLINGDIFRRKKKVHHHHISVIELGHLLTRSGLTYPEISSKVCHDSFCQLGNSVSLP